MKVIDLLNKIANGEEVPSTIKYKSFILNRTYSNEFKRLYVDEQGMWFPEYYSFDLNDEVEVIEEDKKIEEIDMFDFFTGYDFDGTSKDLLKHLQINFMAINEKINEIIDKVNKGE